MSSRRSQHTVPLAQAALFLDLDGTLAPLREQPGDVTPCPRRTQLLRSAGRKLGGRVAIVSGRTIASVDKILEGACVAVAGVHGLQRRSLAGIEMAPSHSRIRAVAGRMARFSEGAAGLLVEFKDQSVALHYRGAPEAESAVVEFVRRLAAQEGLAIQSGHMVMELRTPGMDKGDAVRAFLREAPFLGAFPIYVGDDLTDEPAFEAVASLGGVGVLVGGWRPTAARAHLRSPAEVLAWIRAGLEREAFVLLGSGL